MSKDLKRIILEKEEKRYRYLLAAYEVFTENESKWLQRHDVTVRAGVNGKEADEILSYLSAEGLLEQKTMGGENGLLQISHRGIREIEQSIKNPSHATDHFQVPVIQQVTQHFHSAVGAVQTGNGNTANVSQRIGQDIAELIALLQKIREAAKQLPPAEQQEAYELIDLTENEVKSGDGNSTKIKSYVRSLLPIMKDVASALIIDGIKASVGL